MYARTGRTDWICEMDGWALGARIIDQLDPSVVRARTTDPRPIVWTLVSTVCHRSDSLCSFLL